MPNTEDWNVEKPLSTIKCTSADCENDLHSFLRMRPRGQSYRNGECRECGIDLIDWHRLDQRDLSDVDHTVASLERELIRHVYWHKSIDQRAINHAKRKGLSGMREAAIMRLRNSVGPPRSKLPRDGGQTGFSRNAIFYAQHATATCCRKCIEAWHGIEKENPLTTEQIGYMTELVMHYIQQRVPNLAQHGIKVPKLSSNHDKES